jgi:DNA-binding NtrC family response regulator
VATILIADDERNIRATLGRSLRMEGHTVLEAVDGEEALRHIESGDADAVLLDLQMPRVDGIEVLERLHGAGLRLPVVVLTAHGTIDRAVRAVRLGAFDFIEKPPAIERILLALDNALRLGALEVENRRLSEEAGIASGILGESESIRSLRGTVARVAKTDATVLILGENGTGKELVARALHDEGARRGRPLVVLNCAAVPETLFESELFGHVRGAFTGATESRRGKFQLADGGTLFLDEVGEVPLAMQPKLLRVLETGEVGRVGGAVPERVRARVIAATNRDLQTEVREGRFRQDLYYRLNVVPIEVPPLRCRTVDVERLASHFLATACRRNRIRGKVLTSGALDRLRVHPWPGNVRELRNAMERVAILVPSARVDRGDLEFLSASPAAERAVVTVPSGAFDLSERVARLERELVFQVLERTGWKMARAARELGLERSHLYRKMKSLGIERPESD